MDPENQENNEDEQDNEEVSDPDNPDNANGRRSSKNKNVQEKNKGCCNCKLPPGMIKASEWMNNFCDDPVFEKSIIVLILLNTAFLASEHYD